MDPVAKRVLRLVAITCLTLYAISVFALALMKWCLPGEGGLPWAEVFYGPAITYSTFFGVAALVAWRISRRSRD